MAEPRWLDRLADDPLLLRMPLVRYGNHLTIGKAQDEWKAWVEADKTA
jgi:arsenate reductase-like glutaredoxin family protein